jgi:hypothetical protein
MRETRTVAALLSLRPDAVAGLQHRHRRRQGHQEGWRSHREGPRNERSHGKIHKLDGLVAPLDRANVDTDAIIPKQFLKSIKRSASAPTLFDEWRYLDVGEPDQDCTSKRPKNPDFVLNQPRYQGASILLARENFGCGSSREHAPWALTTSASAPSSRRVVCRHLLQQLLQERPAADRAAEDRGRRAVRSHRAFAGLSPDHRPRRRRRHPAGRARDPLRRRRLPQGMPAQRLGRHRPDPAPRRQDSRVRGARRIRAALAVCHRGFP